MLPLTLAHQVHPARLAHNPPSDSSMANTVALTDIHPHLNRNRRTVSHIRILHPPPLATPRRLRATRHMGPRLAL